MTTTTTHRDGPTPRMTATCARCAATVTEPPDVIARMTGRHGLICEVCYAASKPPTRPAKHWWDLPTAASAWRSDAR